MDATSDGNPYFTVALNGEEIIETDEVERTPNGEFYISLPAGDLRRFAGQEVLVNVTLWEGDLFEDEYIRPVTKTVMIEEPIQVASTIVAFETLRDRLRRSGRSSLILM